MKTSPLVAASAVFLAAGVSAHGNITSPPARQPGAAMAALCGQTAVDTVNSDPTIPIEDLPADALANANCNAFLCRGATFEDQPASALQQFTPGQVVPMTAILPIPHAGPMNVSIVKTATNTVLAGPLISFDVYADEALPELPANNTQFSITIPASLGSAAAGAKHRRVAAAAAADTNGTTLATAAAAAEGDCTQAGDCVLQWFWFGTNAKQTYESCVDFVMV